MAMKDRQHLYASANRTYQQNRALLMVPTSNTIPDIPAFPADVSATPKLGIVPLVPNPDSVLPADP